MNPLRIAAAVVRAPIGEKEENLARVTHWTKIAAEKRCRLICFPEMNITGYCNKEGCKEEYNHSVYKKARDKELEKKKRRQRQRIFG